jgi:6-phosphogluconolactonase (cycloisomerase 2 family)
MRRAAAVLLVMLTCAPAAAAQPPPGWRDTGEVVASPDGRHVYAAGDSMVSFSVDQTTGALTLIDASQPGGNLHPRLAISPDGRFLYTAFGDDINNAGIIIHSRDPQTGLLTHQTTFRGGPEARVALAPIVSLTVSPDGGQLYAVQRKDEALHVFNRDRETGALSIQGSLYTGSGEALDGTSGIGDFALSPDGRFGYLTGSSAVEFARDPATGALAVLGRTTDGYGYGPAIAVSPDGTRVYTGGTEYHVFDRDSASGRLTPRQRSQLTPFEPGCHNCHDGFALGAAADGNVFSSSPGRRALLQAAPTPDGVELRRTYTEGVDGFHGIAHAEGFARSPDGRFLFVSASEYIPPDRYPSSRGDLGAVSSFRYENGGLIPVSSAGPGIETERERRANARPRPRTGISINDGASYTNDPNVTVRVIPELNVGSFRLANAPNSFAGGAIRVDASDHYPWTLAATGGSRDVRRVYVRFTAGQYANGLTDMSDDIILDQRPPQVLGATLTGGRLKLRARDNRSGVRKVQVTRSRKKPGRARKFARRVRVARGARVVHVRVIDGAGNRSRWRKVRAR